MKKNVYRRILTLLMLVSLLCSGSTAAWAAGDSYTMSLVPYSKTAQPGEELNVAVQVTGPASGEKDIAALQANVSYDKDVLEYVDYAAYDGTIALFSEDQGVVAGFGEAQAFTDKLDFIVLTFRVKDGAEGTTQLSLSDPVLAKQGAVELEAVTGADAAITVGSSVPSAAEESETYKPAAPTNATGGLIRGSESDQSGSGTGTTSQGANGGSSSTPAASGSGENGTGDDSDSDSSNGSGDNGNQGSGDSGTSEEGDSAGGFLSGIFGTDSGDDSSASSSMPVGAVILVIVIGAAAIGGCVWYFLVYKKKR